MVILIVGPEVRESILVLILIIVGMAPIEGILNYLELVLLFKQEC